MSMKSISLIWTKYFKQTRYTWGIQFLIAEKFAQEIKHTFTLIDTAQWLNKLEESVCWHSPKENDCYAAHQRDLAPCALIQLGFVTDWFRIFRMGAKLFSSDGQTKRLEWSALQWTLCETIWTLAKTTCYEMCNILTVLINSGTQQYHVFLIRQCAADISTCNCAFWG